MLDYVLPPIFGFVIGFVTNALAIVMLFRPFQEVRFLGLRFHGMIPRRKGEIARSVARVVASDLLKEERIAQRIGGEEVRAALRSLVGELAQRYLGRELGPIASVLGPEHLPAVARFLESALIEAARAAQSWAATPAGRRAAEAALSGVLARSPGSLAPTARAWMTRALVRAARDALGASDLEARVRGALLGLAGRASSVDRSLVELVPPEVRELARRAVTDAVPVLLRRFEEALVSADNLEKIKAAVRSGIREYLVETEGGLVKNVVRYLALAKRERIFREVDEVVDANVYRLGELVYEEENRARLEAGITDALEVLLRRTPGELLASVSPQTLERLCDRAAERISAHLRGEAGAEVLMQAFERELSRLFDTPFGELLASSGVAPLAQTRWAEALCRWAEQGGLERWTRGRAAEFARVLLDVPLGRLSRFLPEGLGDEILGLALDRLMPVISARVPEALRVIDVQTLIEREVLVLPPREVERVILDVAKRELHAITWWGGVLGALVGALQSALAVWGR